MILINRSSITNLLLIVLCVAMISGCQVAPLSSSDLDNDASGDPTTSSTILTGTISGLNLTDSTQTEIDFGDLDDDENILLVLYSSSGDTDSLGFELGDVSESASPSYLTQNPSLDATADFNDQLRQLEQGLNENPLENAQPSTMRYATLGSTRVFKVIDSTATTETYNLVTAELRVTSGEVNFYIDTRDAASLDDADLEGLAAQFRVDEERNLFGQESDVDGDGKIAVLFTRAVNELGGSSGGIITGFFYAIDLFDSSLYEASNEMEIFYTIVPDPAGDYGTAISKEFCLSNIHPSVLPHEYQHMINFNQHYIVNGAGVEESWLNEALSHLAEDMVNLNSAGYLEETNVENPARVSSYLEDPNSLCLSCGTSLSQRGASYLFLRYLYEQAQLGHFAELTNGAEFLDLLVNSDLTGTDNLKAALFGSSSADTEFKNSVGNFGLAVYFSNTNTTSDSVYEFQGINLRSEQDDNRGTILNGPSIQTIASLPLTDTLSGISVSYLTISGQTINDQGGTLQLTIPSGAEIGGYVIRE
ncbi:MAG: hypothetical protein ACD_62C00082G0003 [uncultured bacterium]|nr:MAG: hypothetical protein ACD_62C00082G0003 [uncultured bacterium]